MLLVKRSFPINSLFVFELVLGREERRATVVFIDSEVFQIDALERAVDLVDIDGELGAILAVFGIDGAHLIFLLVAVFDASGAKEIAYSALFV